MSAWLRPPDAAMHVATEALLAAISYTACLVGARLIASRPKRLSLLLLLLPCLFCRGELAAAVLLLLLLLLVAPGAPLRSIASVSRATAGSTAAGLNA
jgi:hypothetical protein